MELLNHADDVHSFFTRSQAKDAGLSDREIAHLLRDGTWHRIRRGFYTDRTTWLDRSPEDQHLVRASAVLHSLGGRACLSHVSALLAHGIATWGMDLSRVHVTRLDGGAGRVEGDVVHHVGRDLEDLVVGVGGMTTVLPARAAVEAGSRTSRESALVSFDSALHLERVTHDELMAMFERMAHWPGTQRLHIPIRMATPDAESPGESRGRWLFRTHGLPAPVCQFEVHDGDGVLRGTCDWGWPELETLGEFDGRIKYGRLLKPGQSPGDVVLAEKQREDDLRDITGFRMVRLIWSDLDRPRVTAQRLRQRLTWRAS